MSEYEDNADRRSTNTHTREYGSYRQDQSSGNLRHARCALEERRGGKQSAISSLQGAVTFSGPTNPLR